MEILKLIVSLCGAHNDQKLTREQKTIKNINNFASIKWNAGQLAPAYCFIDVCPQII
jgi:hypothetical protein